MLYSVNIQQADVPGVKQLSLLFKRREANEYQSKDRQREHQEDYNLASYSLGRVIRHDRRGLLCARWNAPSP
jgi:hypothetical protein